MDFFFFSRERREAFLERGYVTKGKETNFNFKSNHIKHKTLLRLINDQFLTNKLHVTRKKKHRENKRHRVRDREVISRGYDERDGGGGDSGEDRSEKRWWW